MNKLYVRGLILLIVACVLIQAFGKSAENIRLLHCVLEAFGYYTGYLHNPLSISLWILLALIIPVLFFFAFRFMWDDMSYEVKKRFKIIPFCVIIASLMICINMPTIHRATFLSSSGVDAVFFQLRDYPLIRGTETRTGSVTHGELSRLYLSFNRIDSTSESFHVKVVRLDDPSKECDFPFLWTVGKSSGMFTTFGIDEIPGLMDGVENYKDLRFKIVISDENKTKSKTFLLYFDMYKRML